MAATVADIRLRFEEFSDVDMYSDAKIQMMIEDSILVYMGDQESRWCGKYNYAQAYLVAHLLKSATDSAAGDSNSKAGSITSKSAGGVSVTRGSVSKDRSDQDDFLSSTSYGQQFLIVRRSCFAGVLVASGL